MPGPDGEVVLDQVELGRPASPTSGGKYTRSGLVTLTTRLSTSISVNGLAMPQR